MQTYCKLPLREKSAYSHNVLNAHLMDTCLCRLVRDVSAGSSQRLSVSTYKHHLARDQPLLLYTDCSDVLKVNPLRLWRSWYFQEVLQSHAGVHLDIYSKCLC